MAVFDNLESKKSGFTKTKIGTGNSNEVKKITVKSIYDDYANLTVDNFMVSVNAMKYDSNKPSSTGSLSLSYKETTGELTIGKLIKQDGGDSISHYVSYSVYLIV